MTILDAELTALDGVDKAYHPLYTQRDGKWLLTGVKGYTPEDRTTITKTLKTERDNASAAANALKPWKTLFGDKKAEDIQADLDKIEEYKLAAKGKLDEKDLEERVNARLASAKAPLERKVNEATEGLLKAQARVLAYEKAEERAAIRAEIQKHALASSALPESYADGGGLLAVLEGQLTIEVEVDKETGARKLGKVVTKDGADVPALLKTIQTTQGYFWAPSRGTGTRSPLGNGTGGGNPWKKDSFNRTEQMRLLKENPALAQQYQAAASNGAG